MTIYASLTSCTFDIFPPCNACYSIKFTPFLQYFNKAHMIYSDCLSIFENVSLNSQIENLIFVKIYAKASVKYFSLLFITSFVQKENSSCFLPETSQLNLCPPKQKQGERDGIL